MIQRFKAKCKIKKRNKIKKKKKRQTRGQGEGQWRRIPKGSKLTQSQMKINYKLIIKKQRKDNGGSKGNLDAEQPESGKRSLEVLRAYMNVFLVHKFD